jgi:hypothetical protein
VGCAATTSDVVWLDELEASKLAERLAVIRAHPSRYPGIEHDQGHPFANLMPTR